MFFWSKEPEPKAEEWTFSEITILIIFAWITINILKKHGYTKSTYAHKSRNNKRGNYKRRNNTSLNSDLSDIIGLSCSK